VNGAQLYFSPTGRISRRTYWLWFILPVFLLPVLLIVLLPPTFLADLDSAVVWSPATLVVFVAIGLIANWLIILGGIKRMHDRNRPGAFLLFYLIPLIGPLWIMIELGFLRGSIGANRFGPDPLRS
jgi:uncharacterized membrane protein YhaH (DUF805 family)